MRALVAAALVLAALALPPPSSDAAVGDPAPAVTHRIVWDHWVKDRPGIQLESAAADGTDRHRLYDTARGFTIDLSLSHDGGKVAFSPCCQTRFPRLTVVDVNDGSVLDPLAKHRKDIWFVGGIGFSPDDSHVAFEATSKEDGKVTSAAIWTVALDGTDFTKVLSLPWDAATGSVENPALVWTDDGILYSDGQDLRRAADGTSTVVIPGVTAVRGSGDGLGIVTTRPTSDRGTAFWWSDLHGADAQRLVTSPAAGTRRTWISDVIPDFDGQRFIGYRNHSGPHQIDVVTWRLGQPARKAKVLPIPGASGLALTWN